jgi:predicted Zn-dependent protease
MTMVARAALLAAAVAAIAWLAIGLREARLEAFGSAVAIGPTTGLTPARVARAEKDLRDADRLTPHHDPAAFRARLLARTGRRARAVRILESLVRDEPNNAIYWLALERAAARVNPRLAARARARVRELSPIGAPE